MAKRRKKQRVNPDDVHPDVAAGLAQGREEIEADEEKALATKNVAGIEIVRHMRDVEKVAATRIPLPRFVAAPNDAIITEGDRTMQDVNLTFQAGTLAAMRAGNICLRCLEPQPHSFPEECDLCGYAMKERQIMDMAMEFEGDKHLGPAKPMSEYLEEQELRHERRKFEARIAEGRSRGRRARAS